MLGFQNGVADGQVELSIFVRYDYSGMGVNVQEQLFLLTVKFNSNSVFRKDSAR